MAVWTTATRPASPAVGATGFNTTIGSTEYWTGTSWETGILAVGTTDVYNGTSGRVLYDNAGVLGEYTNTQLTALCQAFTTSLSGCVTASGGGTTNFLRADGSWQPPPGGGSLVGTTSATNSFYGTSAGANVTSGTYNTAIGAYSIGSGTVGATGTNNVGVGAYALAKVTGSSINNTGVGGGTGATITTGSYNTLLGFNVGSTTMATGNSNVLIGTAANCDTTAAGTNNQFKVCAATGATDLMVGDMTAGALSLTLGGRLAIPNAGLGVGITAAPNYNMQIDGGAGNIYLQITNSTVGSGSASGGFLGFPAGTGSFLVQNNSGSMNINAVITPITLQTSSATA